MTHPRRPASVAGEPLDSQEDALDQVLEEMEGGGAVESVGQKAGQPRLRLQPHQRAHLRALAHDLKPVVQIGSKGLNESVLAQIGEQLARHELIKVRFNTECPITPDDAGASLAEQLQCELIQRLGRMLVLFKRQSSPDHSGRRIELPKRRKKVPASAAS